MRIGTDRTIAGDLPDVFEPFGRFVHVVRRDARTFDEVRLPEAMPADDRFGPAPALFCQPYFVAFADHEFLADGMAQPRDRPRWKRRT